MIDRRPDPEQLLNRVMQEEERAKRGKLKIFFGASAGVGKTYAMLSAGKQLCKQGMDVVVGIIETHGRTETAAQLEGFEQIPLREENYRDRILKEFDLDATLVRHPALVLVDELAHSNTAGSRHPKRWQDIEELLAAGIDVFTTVNVQHIESLNDVVGGITGIRVWETVPDHIFDSADEVVVVDLPPDELLQRLKEGKVYMPQQAERAIQNFFRKGNLIALRELALRRTADRVDDEMQRYRDTSSTDTAWDVRGSLLTCIGIGHGNEKIIRSSARLASKLNVPWHVLHVETPKVQRTSQKKRDSILKALKLAQSLGAEIATLSGSNITETVIYYARSHNLTRIVVGRSHRSPLPWRNSFVDRLGLSARDLDIVQIACDEDVESEKAALADTLFSVMTPSSPWQSYAISVAACCFTALLATPLLAYFDLANIVMIFLLAVVLVAVKLGRGPAVLAAFLSVMLFDFFFVPPRFSFAVSDVQYLFMFAIMLLVALVTGQLTANLKYQAQVAMSRELRSRSLYEMARELSAALIREQIIDIATRYMDKNFNSAIALILTDDRDQLHIEADKISSLQIDSGIVQWTYDHGQPAGLSTDTLPGSKILYLPLRAPMRIRGVLAIEPRDKRWLLVPEQRRLLETFCTLIAIASERIHYVDVAQSTTVQIESERLRNSLLSAISHDLRTPLTTLMGNAEYLALTRPELSNEQKQLAKTIHDDAMRMTALVNNLLDMGKLQAGEVKLNMEWQPLEEVVGTALAATRNTLAQHTVTVNLPPDLSLLKFDAVLIERVLVNLLENVGKYTQAGSTVAISADIRDDQAQIAVEDNGPGLPAGMEKAIFEKFTRGQKETTTPGVGLGLAIARAIVEAHKGRIWAEKSSLGGARFVFVLPFSEAPPLTSGELLPGGEQT
jgi:two-component system sensor histidine kinase KdpD